MSPIPILWLCGPPGVGKTAVAWEVYQRLLRQAAAPAFVDVDQLGICYPPPDGDPDRHALKARNVAALRTSFATAGARCLIVSGVVDTERGPDLDVLGAGVTTVRLRADPGELRARLRQRDGPSIEHAAALANAEALDRSAFAAICIDTKGRQVDEAATGLLSQIGYRLLSEDGSSTAPREEQDGEGSSGKILWLTGPPGVGKSTIGFRAYLTLLGSGICAAYLDIAQLGFCKRAADDPSVRVRNLSAVWRNFRAAGAERAVITGQAGAPAETSRYEDVLSGATITWRQLRVTDAELTRRILSRGGGGSWAEPGDALKGRSHDDLLAVAARVIAAPTQDDAPVLAVDDLDPDEAAAKLLREAGWPGA